MKNLRVAVIGGGHLGSIHARLLQEVEGAKLVAVADPEGQAQQRLSDQVQAQVVADYRGLLGHIDAAVLAVPTTLHSEIGVELLNHGVHLLVEKPLARNTQEADALVAAARQKDLVLQVGHVEQFNPALRVARQQLRTPRYIEAVREGPLTFRSLDVGVVLDLMIHDIDVILTLVQSEVVSVEATGFAWLGDREDVAQARLIFANGCTASLTASRVSPIPQRVMRLFGDSWHTTIDFASRAVKTVRTADRTNWQQRQISAEERSQLQSELFARVLPLSETVAPETNAISDELDDFVHSIRLHRQPQVPGEQGRAALAVCQWIVATIEAGTRTALTRPSWSVDRRKAG